MRQSAALLTGAPCLTVAAPHWIVMERRWPAFPTECSSDSRLRDFIRIIIVMDWINVALFKDFAGLWGGERTDCSYCKFSSAGSLKNAMDFVFCFCCVFFAWSVKSIRTALPVCFICILSVCFLFMAVFYPPLPSLLESHFKQNKCHYIVNTSGFFWRKKNNKTLKNQINEQKYKLQTQCCGLFACLLFYLVLIYSIYLWFLLSEDSWIDGDHNR